MVKNKRGQLKLSFGMIFSVILIILFVSFAVWGIVKLINLKEDVDIDKFPNDLQDDIDEVHSSTYGNQSEKYSLPKKVDLVCFVNEEYGKNLQLVKIGDQFNTPIKKFEIEDIDIEKTIQNSGEEGEDKFCIENTGDIELVLIKEEGENLVEIDKK